MEIIDIKEDIQIGNIILEKGDKIRVIEGKLLSTSPTLEGIKKSIAHYFYDNSPDDITLEPESDNVWGVYKTKSGKYLTNFRVIFAKNKYRFEEK